MGGFRIPPSKIAVLRTLYFNGMLDRRAAAKGLGIDFRTIGRYTAMFKKIKKHYPEKISDKNFYLPVVRERRKTRVYVGMLNAIPEILKRMKGQKLNSTLVYPIYNELCPDGYPLSTFKHEFFKWCDENGVRRQNLDDLPAEDVLTLNKWRKGNHHQRWQIAVALLDSRNRATAKNIMGKIEVSAKTLALWEKNYQEKGLKGFEWDTHATNPAKALEIKTRQDNLIHIMHQLPKLYGFNRTSWKQQDLAIAYFMDHGIKINNALVSRDLRARGYRMLCSRPTVTSPVPDFKEKYEVIQNILRTLGPKERFFSIDEYGPFSLKIKGGRSSTKKGTYNSFPQIQQSKGWLICTAALELSTNQVSHFYSLKKNTEEMIKMIDMLINQYRDEEKLYISWDKASWHLSKELIAYIKILNSDQFHQLQDIPYIQLAPLPASSQFLNVIESVFSGLARSVIHHSNYQSVDECKLAITTYFEERNKHFQANPHKAGDKIWGKELVPPYFDKAHRCKTGRSLASDIDLSKD